MAQAVDALGQGHCRQGQLQVFVSQAAANPALRPQPRPRPPFWSQCAHPGVAHTIRREDPNNTRPSPASHEDQSAERSEGSTTSVLPPPTLPWSARRSRLPGSPAPDRARSRRRGISVRGTASTGISGEMSGETIGSSPRGPQRSARRKHRLPFQCLYDSDGSRVLG